MLNSQFSIVFSFNVKQISSPHPKITLFPFDALDSLVLKKSKGSLKNSLMKNLPNIFFDLDGTLVDSLPGIEKTLRAALLTVGADPETVPAFRPLVGYPLETVFSFLLGEGHPEVAAAARTYRRLYPEMGLPGAMPYEGIPEMLRALRSGGKNLHIVTARNETMAGKILKNHGLDGYILSVRGEREGDGRESKADLVADVLVNFHLNPSETVMIGDRRFDTEAARANGCMAIGVTYGYGTREELVEGGTEVLADTPAELANILNG